MQKQPNWQWAEFTSSKRNLVIFVQCRTALRPRPAPKGFGRLGLAVVVSLTPENSTSGRGPWARRTIPAPSRTRLRGPANATGKLSRENRWHGHGPASPHIPRASMQSTRAGSGAPSGEAKRRGPRRLGSRSRRSGRAHDRRRDCGFRASSSAWPRRGGGVATDRSTRHARALADHDINLAMVEIVVVDEFAIELPLLLKQRRRRLVEHLSLHQLLRSSNRQPKMPHKSR